MRDPHIAVHGLAPGLNYGQHAFEGMKAHRTADGRIALFRPDQNAKRLQHSAEVISIPPVPTEHFLACVRLAVGLNAAYVPPFDVPSAAMYVRPLLFGRGPMLAPVAPETFTFAVFALPVGVLHGNANPVDTVICEDLDRAAPRGVGHAKLGGNYAPVTRWAKKAKGEGYGIMLHLDAATRSEIDEFSTSALAGAVYEGGGCERAKIVLPDSPNVIESVTQKCVEELARAWGWDVERRRVPVEELATFDEVMAAGTATVLQPVMSITYPSKETKYEYAGSKDGKPGWVCKKLTDAIVGTQRGTVPDKLGWLDYVEDPAAAVNGEGGHARSNDQI